METAKHYLGLSSKCNSSLSYEELPARVKDRVEPVRRFEAFLRAHKACVTSPASTRFHLARPGGLIDHSVKVANTLLKLRAVLAPELSKESCVIVALYNDPGKTGMPGKPYYRSNPDSWIVNK